MTFIKRDLCPEVTDADRCTLVFDTDSKRLYVELEVTHSDAAVRGTVDYQIATMDIADYLNQGGQTAGHRELWRLLRTLFEENSDNTECADETSSAAMTYSKFRIWENSHDCF
ncbi:hypothetical protein [Bradyrhizobium sp.]|uniref:hypothetical protein n=1 Tax=Bradyrhizobium sp. TaxID=376 RepID=UPI003C789D63